MGNTYTVSEIAKIFSITTNKIRFYEKKGLLEPLRENENKYRKFTDEDIMRLHSILLYRSIGLSIEDIKDIIKHSNKKNYLEHFNNQWELVNNEIQKLNTVTNSL